MDKKKLEERRPDIEYLDDPIVSPSTTSGLEAADLFDGARIMLNRPHPDQPGEAGAADDRGKHQPRPSRGR